MIYITEVVTIFMLVSVTAFRLRDAIKKKNYLDRDIVPISSDPPTYETDRDNW